MYVYDLFSSSTPAYLAANTAFQVVAGTGTKFALTPAQLATIYTGLSVDPASNTTPTFFSDANNPNNANMQIVCALNNVVALSPPEPKLTLYGAPSNPLPGVGAVIGWQTEVLQGGYCTIPSGAGPANNYYDAITASGYSVNSGQFLEGQTDAAFDDIQSCSYGLATANTAYMANTPSTAVCTYPSN